MVVVSPDLVRGYVERNELLKKAYEIIANDPEVKELWFMSNVMAVKRLKYNDHGPVHAHIAAGAALEIYKLLLDAGIESSLVKDGVLSKREREYAWVVVLYGGLLHDIGNAIHRDLHEKLGAILAKPIIDRALLKILDEDSLRIRLRQEIMHSIHCTAYDVPCLTIEAGCVSVGDGLDMAEGRARVPYKVGQVNIHTVSALSIKKVEILEGEKTPVKINVYMDELAGVFQVDEVLMPKLEKTPIKDYIEISIIAGNKELKSYSPRL
ncbi:MAG: phosphohydrolase [Thermoprotei archaeon]|nr:MAG: phosphohydrolase [Thermoprotei archaeon]